MSAQTAGAGAIIDQFNSGIIYINAQQCATQVTRELIWTVMGAGATQAGVFQVYATNVAPSTTLPDGTTVSGFTACPTSNSTTNGTIINAAQIFPTNNTSSIPATQGSASGFANFNTSDFVAAAGFTADCTTQTTETINVCIEFFPFISGTTTQATDPTAGATGTITVDTLLPGVPSAVTLGVGDTRLYATWTAPTAGAEAASTYTVFTDVTPSTGTCQAAQTSSATSLSTSATSATISGLTDGTPYCVWVVAATAAGNIGTASTPAVGTPAVVDNFWQLYGGREQGGCSGPAGPLALLGAAGALALMRRRRETR